MEKKNKTAKWQLFKEMEIYLGRVWCVGGSLCMHPGPCGAGCSWGMGGQGARVKEQGVQQLTPNPTLQMGPQGDCEF